MTLPTIPRLTGARRLGPFQGSGGMSRSPYTGAQPAVATGVSDTFDRADQTPLGVASSGQSWTSVVGTGISVVANQAKALIADVRMDVLDSGLADGVVRVTFAEVAGVNQGLAARVADASNYLLLEETRLRQVAAGVGTSLVTGLTINAGDVMELVLSGPTVTVRQNGVTVGTGTTVLTAGARHGLRTFGTIATFDNFQVTAA